MLPTPPIVFRQQIRPPIVDQILYRAYRLALDDALLEMAQYLQESSPRGISPPGESLKGGWDIVPARKVRGLMTYEGAVVNLTPNAYNRLRGRGPGRFPPFQKGSPLEQWAKAHGIPAFLVARKIAREGTDRWKRGSRSGRMELDLSTELGRNAMLIFQSTFEKSLAARL